jgi:hypothetical protein
VALPLDTAAVETFDHFGEKLKRAVQDTRGCDCFEFLINSTGISHHSSIDRLAAVQGQSLDQRSAHIVLTQVV